MKIRNHFLIILLSISLIPLIVLSLVSFNESEKILNQNHLESMSKLLIENKINIMSTINTEKYDVLVLANTPAIPRIFRALENNGIDPVTSANGQQELERYSGYLANVLKLKPNIINMELLDKNFYRLAEISKNDDGITQSFEYAISSQHEHIAKRTFSLQEKEIIVLKPKQELMVPTLISYSTPIYLNDIVHGALIMDVSFDDLIFPIMESHDYEIFFSTPNGVILSHYINGEKLDTSKLIQEHFAEILPDDFFDYNSNEITIDKTTHIVFQKIPFSNDPTDYFLLTLKSNVNVSAEVQNFNILITAITIIFIFVVGIYSSSKISKPINKLKNISQEIADGNLDIKIESEGNDEIQELGNAIRKMAHSIKENRALEKVIAQKEKFALIGSLSTRMSHDLRNPLSIIKISMENMKTLYEIGDIQQHYFDKINRAIDRMVHQVDDVLDFVKGEPADMNRVKFSEILVECMDSLKIPNKIKLILPKNDVELICDKKHFSVVMTNLILNGIQSIEDTGTIEVSVEENDDGIVIQVKDSGKGIPKEEQEKIFEPLFTTKQSGTGLGLVSVKSIIDLHGGLISVISPPTIFTITLPKIHD